MEWTNREICGKPKASLNLRSMLVVTSVYNADYDNLQRFCSFHKLELLVYNKNNSLKLGEEYISYKSDQLTIIDIPNIGRCDYAFLYYIVTHYDNMPERVLFTKANYMDQCINLEPAIAIREAPFVLMGRDIKYGIFDKAYDITSLMARGVHKNDIELLYSGKDDMIDPCFQSNLTWDFYKIVYGNKLPPKDEILNFGHGPSFAVNRELILAHDKSVYETLLHTFYSDKGHWTDWPGHSADETYYHLGKRYHDNLLRFWFILFVQDYSLTRVITDLCSYVVHK